MRNSERVWFGRASAVDRVVTTRVFRCPFQGVGAPPRGPCMWLEHSDSLLRSLCYLSPRVSSGSQMLT